MRTDYRSPEAALYRVLYKSRAWQDGRREFLELHPLCQPCEQQRRTALATVVNHRIPHRGDAVLFWDRTNWQAVCKPCHDGPIQKAEGIGFSPAVDAGGWPTDPKHPSNRPRPSRRA